MPKKFQGQNTKAVEAKARKAAVVANKKAQKEKEEEDEYWRDDEKNVVRKQQRKEEQERKKHEAQLRKLEKKALLEQEESALESKMPRPESNTKITQHAIISEAERKKEQIAREEEEKKLRSKKISVDDPLVENLNRLEIEGVHARTVEEAIAVVSDKPAAEDAHPEKRMRAAYNAFEGKNLPRLKKENPNMRLSQLKQLLRKEWMKSPDNPVNQLLMAKN